MSISRITGVTISGIASAVPEHVHPLTQGYKHFGQNDLQVISNNIGVKSKYEAGPHICTSDLCYVAAESLMQELNCAKTAIDTLIFVSQTPDYRLPATSCILQHRLGIASDCAAFDINMGCSGYVYGLWVAANLIKNGCADRILLLVGDTSTKLISPKDRSVALLFGDAGTATLLEKSNDISPMTFILGTDGGGSNNLIVPYGGFRNPASESSSLQKERENGNIRSDENLYMNGPEIFAFTLERVTPLIKSILKETNWSAEEVDYFIFHQANKYIIEYLSKRHKIPLEKVPIELERFGNTSSASIPLTICAALKAQLGAHPQKLILTGFGVGYSWGAVSLLAGPMTIPEIQFVQ
jgi:3-oxoacyl-[acyl-carrier-protein] synthase-3